MFSNADEALSYIASNDIAMVDLKVVGVAGQWLHITIPAGAFGRKHFEQGVGYDGSSGSGFGTVECGDVSARPDAVTAFLDPFWDRPTLSFICSTVAADTGEPFARDPRTIANKAVAYMRDSGVADEAHMAPEYEFAVLDRVEVRNDPYHAAVRIESAEVAGDGAAPVIRARHGYLRTPPGERLHNFRSEVALILEGLGIPVRYHHHEVGAAGQCEIEVSSKPLVRAADHAMMIKYVVKNVARRHGKLATFMPKPIYGEAGNGMHVHQALYRGERNLFFDERQQNYADLSDLALQYVGGLLHHGPALTALTNPSTNSFKRLVPGYEAPVNLFFSLANRSAAIRVPKYAVSASDKRIEYRPPDFSGNAYLSLAAMLMAGLDGIRRKIDVAERNFGPFDVDIAAQDEDFRSRITPLPQSVSQAMRALQSDADFLTAGGVFPAEFLNHWAAAKCREESEDIAPRPHPFEYELYLDV